MNNDEKIVKFWNQYYTKFGESRVQHCLLLSDILLTEVEIASNKEILRHSIALLLDKWISDALDIILEEKKNARKKAIY